MPHKRRKQSPKGRTPRQLSTSRNRWIGFLSLLVLVALVIFLPAFHAQEIRVSPTRAMTADQIRAVVPIKPNQHLLVGLGPDLMHALRLRNRKAESQLRANFPYIRDVEVRLDFPGAINIVIEERIEVAYVAIPDGCVMLDKEGFALRILPESPSGIPFISGVQVTSLILGQKLTVSSLPEMNGAVSTLSAIIDADKDTRTPQKLLSQIRSIRPLSDGRLFLTLALPATGDELTVTAENSADLLDDMLWLRFAMDQGALNDRGKGVLDLTGSRKIFIPDA
ncbi:MAG: FtsQ-type POTRA domain-containing protein [Eubacteriales bacterium]|nr:FtsQ-type POTRA domain-containing protein [Eubacteriales bacterium]